MATSEFVVSEDSKGDFCVTEKNDKYFRQLKASLKAKAAKTGSDPSAVRLDYFDEKIDTATIPTERQSSRTRSDITGKTRFNAPGESPAVLSQIVVAFVRKRSTCPSIVDTFPGFSKVDEKTAIVSFTCDVMLAAAQKFIVQGVSTTNEAHKKVIRFVGRNT